MTLPAIPSNSQAKLDFSKLNEQFEAIKSDSSKIENASRTFSLDTSEESVACALLATKFFREICPEANSLRGTLLDRGIITQDVNDHPYFRAIYSIVINKLIDLGSLHMHPIPFLPTGYDHPLPIMRFVLKNYPEIKERYSNLSFPFHNAVLSFDLDSIKKVYDENSQAIEDQDYNKNTPLHAILEKMFYQSEHKDFDMDNAIECVKFLIENGPEAAKKQNNNLDFPLHIAATYCNDPLLIKKIYEINTAATGKKNKSGNTPLHLAAQRYKFEKNRIVETLDPVAAKIVNCLLELDPVAAKIENELNQIPLFVCNLTNLEAWVSLINAYPEGTGHLLSKDRSLLTEMVQQRLLEFDDQMLTPALEVVDLILMLSPELFSPDGKRSEFPEIDICLQEFDHGAQSAFYRFKRETLKKIIERCPQSTLYRDQNDKTILMNLAEYPHSNSLFIKKVAEAQASVSTGEEETTKLLAIANTESNEDLQTALKAIYHESHSDTSKLTWENVAQAATEGLMSVAYALKQKVLGESR